MHSTIVISWVAIGFFVAWIGTHLVKDQTQRDGIANLATAVFGALLGGLVAHEIVWARIPYNEFLLCGLASFITSALFVGLTRVLFPWRVNSHVS